MVVECSIPRKNHRDVMGPKGSHVQGVTQEFNVTIKFPERDTSSSTGARKKVWMLSYITIVGLLCGNV